MNRLAKFLSIILLIFSTLALIYIVYRAEFHNSGEKFYKYWTYYLIAIPLFLISIYIFFIPTKKKINILLILFSTIVGLYFVEIFLIFKSGHIIKNFFFDDRTRYEVFLEEKKNNLNTIISVEPAYFLYDYNIDYYPLSGISKTRTIHCNESGYHQIYNSDRFGFNSPDHLWDETIIDYIMVGDSFAHGACVNYPNTLRDIVSENKKRKIINLGLSGNGPLTQYAVLKEFFKFKKTKNILFFYYEDNDLFELGEEIKNPILSKYYFDDKYLQYSFFNQSKTDEIIQDKFDKKLLEYFKKRKGDGFLVPAFMKFTNLRNLLKKFSKEKNINSYTYDKKFIEQFDSIIKKVSILSKKNNANLYVVYIPGFNRFSNKELFNDLNHRNYGDIINVLEKNQIIYIDSFKELFKKHPDPLSLYPFRNFGHFNNEGYKLLGNKIIEKLKY